jgi:hypothetical protein
MIAVAFAIFGVLLLRLQQMHVSCSFRPIWDQCLSDPFHNLASNTRLHSAMLSTGVAYIRHPMVIICMFYFIFSRVSSLMSTPTTPAGSPQHNDAASWKQKYELLETQYAMYKEPNAKSQRQVVPQMCSMIRTELSLPVSQLDRSPWDEVSIAP